MTASSLGGTALRGSSQRPKVACAVTLTLVFLCGALSGVVGARFLSKPAAPFWTAAGKEISLQKWSRTLDLNAAQTEQMEVILNDFATYYRSVLGGAYARIESLLNPDQQQKFRELLKNAREEQRR
ncbi:MAG: hypothetical protein WD696_10540 [Bryobacteraceae bacterium]